MAVVLEAGFGELLAFRTNAVSLLKTAWFSKSHAVCQPMVIALQHAGGFTACGGCAAFAAITVWQYSEGLEHFATPNFQQRCLQNCPAAFLI